MQNFVYRLSQFSTSLEMLHIKFHLVRQANKLNRFYNLGLKIVMVSILRNLGCRTWCQEGEFTYQLCIDMRDNFLTHLFTSRYLFYTER